MNQALLRTVRAVKLAIAAREQKDPLLENYASLLQEDMPWHAGRYWTIFANFAPFLWSVGLFHYMDEAKHQPLAWGIISINYKSPNEKRGKAKIIDGDDTHCFVLSNVAIAGVMALPQWENTRRRMAHWDMGMPESKRNPLLHPEKETIGYVVAELHVDTRECIRKARKR